MHTESSDRQPAQQKGLAAAFNSAGNCFVLWLAGAKWQLFAQAHGLKKQRRVMHHKACARVVAH